MRHWAVIGLLLLALPLSAQQADTTVVGHVVATPAAAQQDTTPPVQPKDTIYQGTCIRVDILNPAFELMRSDWHSYAIEAALSVRLKDRFFPTLEFGHAGRFLQENADRTKNLPDSLYHGSGQFARVGLDINPLKKHPESRSVLLVGVRLGTGWQHIAGNVAATELRNKWIADVWGEVLAGVQVDVYKGFNMGWAVRMKFLFTKNSHGDTDTPYYIPGFGFRNEMNWGFDYFLGYTF